MEREEKYAFYLVNTNTRLISPGYEWMTQRQATADNERLERTCGKQIFYTQTPEEVLKVLETVHRTWE